MHISWFIENSVLDMFKNSEHTQKKEFKIQLSMT